MMDCERLVKKEFGFLKKLGFKVKNYTRNFEIEFDFFKEEVDITINYVGYNNEVVDCGIKVADKKENLLKNTIFDKEKTEELRKLISENIGSAQEQIKIYARFISQNISGVLDK